MKKLLFILCLAMTAPAMATSTCTQMRQLIESSAQARDNGVPMSYLHSIVDDSKLAPDAKPPLKQAIKVLYDNPGITPAMAGQAMGKGCKKNH